MILPWDSSLGFFPGILPWDSSLGFFPGILPWDSSLGFCPGILPLDSALGFCPGILPGILPCNSALQFCPMLLALNSAIPFFPTIPISTEQVWFYGWIYCGSNINSIGIIIEIARSLWVRWVNESRHISRVFFRKHFNGISGKNVMKGVYPEKTFYPSLLFVNKSICWVGSSLLRNNNKIGIFP
jgi:hypothetical protein